MYGCILLELFSWMVVVIAYEYCQIEQEWSIHCSSNKNKSPLFHVRQSNLIKQYANIRPYINEN